MKIRECLSNFNIGDIAHIFRLNDFGCRSFIKLLETIQFPALSSMEQSSPFSRYNDNKVNQQELEPLQQSLGLETKGNNFRDQSQQDGSRNIFLLPEKEEKVEPESNKKTKKLKIFGISENKINKQSFQIPDFFQIQEMNKIDAQKDVKTPILFESKIDIRIDNLLKASKEAQGQALDQNQNKQVLQRLLELSQSSSSVAKPSVHSQSQHSVQTNEIDQLLKVQIMEKSYLKPQNSDVSNNNKRILKVTQSQFVEIEEGDKKEENVEQIKNEEQPQVDMKEIEKDKQINVLLKERRPSSISQQQEPNLGIIQQISNLKDIKVKGLLQVDFILQKTPQMLGKESQKARKRKKATNQQYFPQKNIKNYLKRSKIYDKQIQKMIDKFQKATSLKSKEKKIHTQLDKLNEQKKKLNIGQHSPIYICSEQSDRQPQQIRSLNSEGQHQNKDNLMFVRSTDSFRKNRGVKPEKMLQQELKRDVRKMQKIIDRFKVISQTISIDKQVKPGSRQAKLYLQNQWKNAKGEITQMMNSNGQTESFLRGTAENQNLNEKQQLVDSGVYKTIKIAASTQRINPNSQDFKNNSLRTEKKFSNTLTDKFSAGQQRQCLCTHEEIVQQIKRLKQKIDSLQSNKNNPSKIEVSNDISCKIQIDKHQLNQQSVKENDKHSLPKQEASLRTKNSKLTQKMLSKEKMKSSKGKKLPYKPKRQLQSVTLLNEDNSFQQNIDFNRLDINFPKLNTYLLPTSSETVIVNFGENLYSKLLQYASLRKSQKQKNIERKIKFKIKKYEDCIHFYSSNPINYHLVYYYKGKIYFGEWKEARQGGFKKGFGYFLSPSKYVYEGQFQFDKKHGKGTINYLNGEIYKGQWVNNKKSGKGILVNSLGDIYKGTFANGKKNGLGEEKLKNGDFYRGMFKDGKLDGEGTYWWANGSVYKGGFRNGLLHGKGVWKSIENDCYEGQYKDNKKYGQGTYRWSNGMIFSGFFNEDETFVQKKTPILRQASLQRKSSTSGGKNRKIGKSPKGNHHLLHKLS